MGTVYNINKSRIVEIENEIESKKSRTKAIGISSVLIFAVFAAMLNTGLFSQLNVFNKGTMLIGAGMMLTYIYLTSSEEYNGRNFRMLICIGAALFVTSLLAMF
jgi:hypothetical protein